MNSVNFSEAIKYVGVNDYDIDLFESQYVLPNGVSYNSYIIFDEKIAIMDTVDKRKTDEWLSNVEKELAGKTPDYVVVHHMEPDHAGSLKVLLEKYPTMQVVSNVKAFNMMGQFMDVALDDRKVVVKEGDTLELGSHILTFVMAPMVHWPEVMVSYESSEKVLFSADGFGKFGTLDTDEDWISEARRYYINIVGKYGVQVLGLLKKAAGLDIKTICPLHGPMLTENLEYYIGKYQTWASYTPEDDGVLLAYASIHGNTAEAAKKLAAILEEKGAKKVIVTDLARSDMADAVENAFRYDKLVCMSATYDGGLFPVMEDFLYHLEMKGFQKRKVALGENGSWAPQAAKKMTEHFEKMKNITLCENKVSIKSAMKEHNVAEMEALAEELLG